MADEAALAGCPKMSGTAVRRTRGRSSTACWHVDLWGWKGGYFTEEEDARAFFDEHRYMLAMQMAAPNSPQWFNTGLHWAYGIDGPGQGHYYVDHETGRLTQSTSAYEHPQPHACFIQSIEDDLVNENGIMDLWVREARLFKYGSGTGTNFSSCARLTRSCPAADARPAHEPPRSGIVRPAPSSRAAPRGALRRWSWSTSTTRTSRVHQLEGPRGAEGRRPRHRLQDLQKRLKAIMKACVNCEAEGDACFDPSKTRR